MPSSTVCWGIELGAGAVKALKLVRDGDGVSVADFAYIPHKRPLSDPDVDEQDAMRVALGTLVTQKDLSKASIAISVPGHSSFARFAKLPPVEPKKVAELVKFEAAQQIPFAIDEVEWDYQTFVSDDEPDIEVGIFAVTRERVMERLHLWEDVKLTPDCLALSPVAVFNAIAFDQQLTPDTPGTVLLDIGTIATDLIVIEAGRVWIRTFPMGGHAFTEAIASSFKLEYAKAEKLKREADSSKYKRQIFQAMRATFADFGQDVQRSLQYYQQLHPDANLKRVVGIGSTFKLPGIRKVLSQQLRMDVDRCEGFDRLSIEGPEASNFQSVALNMPTAYGLALQGLRMGTIDANLIPLHVVRQKVWKSKVPWFAAAAVLSVAAGGASFVKPMLDSASVASAKSSSAFAEIGRATSQGNRLRSDWQDQSGSVVVGASTANIESLTSGRSLYPLLMRDINAMLASADPQPELFESTAHGSIAPDDWRFFELVSCAVRYKTPSAGTPKWTGEYPVATQTAQPDGAQETGQDDRGGRRGGGGGGRFGGKSGGGGFGGASSRPSTRNSQRDETFGQDALESGGQFGSFEVTLAIKASNDGLQAFVDETIIEWLRTHQDDATKPYTFAVPDVSQVDVRVVQTAGTIDEPEAFDSDSAGRESATSARGGNRAGTSSVTSGSLDDIAPISGYSAGFPIDADVYQYTLTFAVTIRNPEAVQDSPQAVFEEARR